MFLKPRLPHIVSNQFPAEDASCPPLVHRSKEQIGPRIWYITWQGEVKGADLKAAANKGC